MIRVLGRRRKPSVANRFAQLLLSFPQIYNKLRNHLDIRFEVKKIEKTSDKAFLLIQVCARINLCPNVVDDHIPPCKAVLGGIGLKTEFKGTDSQPYLEALSLFRHAPRIARGESVPDSDACPC